MNNEERYNGQAYYHHHSGSSVPQSSGRPAADSVQDAYRLMAMYPLGSATPITHATRHLASLSTSASPPSYTQEYSFAGQGAQHVQRYPPFNDYSRELAHITTPSATNHERLYWEVARDDAVMFLREQGPLSQYDSYPSHWSYPQLASTSYRMTPFAQSVYHHSVPASSYPTPPPPGIIASSSSLANALGDPVIKPQKSRHHQNDSARFFNSFIAENTAGLTTTQTVQNNLDRTPRQNRILEKEVSPDPLTMSQRSPQRSVSVDERPRKRKHLQLLDSSSMEQARQDGGSLDTYTIVSPRKPSTPSSSIAPVTPTPKLKPYVEVPPLPHIYMTPVSRKRKRSDMRSNKLKGSPTADLGGFGSEGEELSLTACVTGSSSRRTTGERDERAPIEKFISLLEDVVEAEDSLPPDACTEDLPSEWFSSLTVDCSQPLLHPHIIRKVMNNISKVARPVKGGRLAFRMNDGGVKTPRSGRVSEIDTSVLARILKMLERSVRAGEDVHVFESQSPYKDPKITKSADSTDNYEGRSISRPPLGGQDNLNELAEIVNNGSGISDNNRYLTDSELDKLTTALTVARDSVLAADCCIALLTSDRLTKQLYSEELITTCLKAVKNQLTNVVYPFVEASGDGSGPISPLLRHILLPSSRDSHHRRQVAEIFQVVSSVIPRINDLISADNMAMSESIIIQAVYIAIGPFFITEAIENEGKGKRENVVLNTLGNSAMRGLRLDALSLIRSIFANHEDQRSWIIEEILSSLVKLSDSKQKAGQFRLRDGRSIRTVSALLLQLVQTSAHDVRIEARNLRMARQQLAARINNADHSPTATLADNDAEETRLYINGLDSATKAAKTVVIFLTQRSGKTKTTKNSNEAEYRAIFDNLVSDLLAVLFWPEWPAASLLLGIVCKFMISALDDIKTTNSNDNNAAKILGLDHLGVIAARLRTCALDASRRQSTLSPVDEITAKLDIKQLQSRVAAHQDLASHLSKRSSEDQALDSARELTAVIWGQELAVALQQCHHLLTDRGDDDFDPKIDRNRAHIFVTKAKAALRDVWQDSASDIFDIGVAQEEIKRIDSLSEEIGIAQNLKNLFQPTLNVILQALDAPPVFMRTKALKALGQIVLSDPNILSASNVRTAIESHLVDSSPAVRDTAVELIGKFMIELPEFAATYYHKIAERIVDTGLAVRKRVIKLLKSFHSVTDDRSLHIDICTRVVLRMGDEDDSVKDLAVKTIEELWFQGPNAGSTTDKSQLQAKVAVMMGVTSRFKDRNSPLEDMLHKIMSGKNSNDASTLHGKYVEICEVLIDGLVDASDLPDFTVVNCVRTIHLFTSAYPAVLSGSNASILLPYLKNATTPEEQMTSDVLLRIFRTSLPYMPKTAAKFGQELQAALQPLLLKPSSTAGSQGLQEAVACMCAVVHHITHDFTRLIGLLRSCNARLQQYINKPTLDKLSPPEQRILFILLCIVSLLCEHCSFDKLRLDHPTLRPEIDNITKGSVTEYIFRCAVCLYQKFNDPGMRGRILLCLGFLFRAQPALMTAEASTKIMDSIFASAQNDDARARLLKIIQDFLVSEATKHSAREKSLAIKANPDNVNMEELIGNTDGFADSGVSSTVVQRYLDSILHAALSQIPSIQGAAVDILSFTVKQGLAHPIQSFPVIVTLETSPVVTLSRRASALHALLHGKHGSLLNSQSRYISSARASYDYQKKLSQGVVQGYRLSPNPTALLQRWYSMVREKRATRQDFLQHLVKVFNIDMASQLTYDDIGFTRYMADNFATLEYKTLEEVLTVLKYLTNILSTSGMHIVEKVSPSNLLAQLHAPAMHAGTPHIGVIAPSVDSTPHGASLSESGDAFPQMRISVIISIIMLLKAHLKFAYGISEERCTKFVIGKKSAVGDRPAVRKHERPITWERLPYALAPLLTNEDAEAQRVKFLEIWNEDGLIAEPEDDLA